MLKNKTLENIIISFLAFISTFGITLNLFKEFNGNSIIFVLLFIVLIKLIKQTIKLKEKNLIICSAILAFGISLIQLVGYSLEKGNSLWHLYSSKMQLLKNTLEFTGLFIVFYCCIALLYNYLLKIDFTNKDKKGVFFSNNKKSFFLVWACIFLAWIPLFIIYFPGICSPDSIWQIRQALGNTTVTSHHPIFHTFIISICLKAGIFIADINVGVALYSIVQMLIMSCIFSFAIFYMGKKDVHKYIRIGCFIFFAFFPINVIYSFTMWKNIIFGGVMILFTICIIEMTANPELFFKKKKNWILFLLTLISVVLFINNGFYVILLSFPLFIIFMKKYRIKLIAIFLTIITFNMLFTGPVYTIFNVEKGSSREALSVPLQQIARVVKYRSDDLSEKELEVIRGILSVENIGEYYNPRLSDPVKNHFNNEYYESNKMEFFTTWFKMFFKFPKEYITSYLSNSFGYWYPETVYWTVGKAMWKNDLGIKHFNSPEQILGEQLSGSKGIFNARNIPVVSMVYSIGFNFILLMFFFLFAIIKKRYKFLLAFIPVLCLILTATASPVYAEYRYVYSLVTCLPILISFALSYKKPVLDDETVE